MVSAQPEPTVKINVTFYHPGVEDAFERGVAVSSKHPSVHALLRNVLPETHPNVDDVLKNPKSNYPLPAWHPNISTFILHNPKPNVTIRASGYHPDVDVSYANGVGASLGHPSIHAALAHVLPDSHPDVDYMLRSPAANPLPKGWHPNLSEFNKPQPKPILKHAVSHYHPDIDVAYKQGVGVDVKSHPDLQLFFEAELPPTHPEVMAMLAAPSRNLLPYFHPNLSIFQDRLPAVALQMDVSHYHPPLMQQYEAGIGVDLSKHPDVAAFFANVTPPTHPPIMRVLTDPNKWPLPEWHMNLTMLQKRQPAVTLQMGVSHYHPDIAKQYEAGAGIDRDKHPDIESYFAAAATMQWTGEMETIVPILPNVGWNNIKWISWPPSNTTGGPSLAQPFDAAEPLQNTVAGGFVVAERNRADGVEFATQALHAQRAGADAVLIINDLEGALPIALPTDANKTVATLVTIPVFLVAREPGLRLVQLIENVGGVKIKYQRTAITPPTHPSILEMLAHPKENPLPDWHVALDALQVSIDNQSVLPAYYPPFLLPVTRVPTILTLALW